MAKLQNTFTEGKLNLDIDERILPKGQYPYALNTRLGNTDGSDIGAIETVRGNRLISDLGLTNAKCIGAYDDNSNRTLYWFVTSDEKDLLMEYNESTTNVVTILESDKSAADVLKFDKNYLITGINKVINGDPDNDLLFWTDNLNAPRVVNIKRAKDTYTVDSFIEDDISVIKKPPAYAPVPLLQSTVNSENFLEDKFVAFASRYKYLDGGYSALSSFTSYQFFPKRYKLNYQTLENEGMVNLFNQVSLDFDTGSKRVTDIQIVFRESKKSIVNVIETFNKEDEGWSDNATETFVFNNSKKYDILPSDELSRIFDNVPLLAKSQEFIGNRLVYGNYVEGYDLLDSTNQKVVMDYTLALESKSVSYNQLTYILSGVNATTDKIGIDVYGIPLVENLVLNFNIILTTTGASYLYNYSYILPEDFVDAAALIASADFIYFVEEIMTASFITNVVDVVPTNTTATTFTGFKISTGTAWQIPILAPFITYEINSGADPDEIHYWDYTDVSTDISYSEADSNRSLKSNRSYEIGKVYMDDYNRASTVLTNPNNTISVPPEYSDNQNKIRVNINHNPPSWATRYKFVIKQNKKGYETVYVNRFYEDGLYNWVKLEGTNKDKVKEGNTLIVKSDFSGILDTLVKVKVLEVTSQNTDFIPQLDTVVDPIIEEAGLYMKIKPSGFNMDLDNATQLSYDDSGGFGAAPEISFNNPPSSIGGIFNNVTGVYDDVPHLAGTRVRLFFEIKSAPSSVQVYEKSFVAQNNHATFDAWYLAEVVDLGTSFEAQLDPSFPRFPARDGTNKLTMQLKTTAGFFKKLEGKIDIIYSEGDVIFETDPDDLDDEVFYETGLVFDITDNEHQGNVQNQSIVEQTSGVLVVDTYYRLVTFETGDDFTNVGGVNQTGSVFKATGTTPTTWTNASIIVEPAVSLLDSFNCYVMGNGAESYKYSDSFNVNSLEMNLRPNLVDPNGYKEVRRYADLTYSEPYNENTSLNGLNEFNLSRANWKDDIEKKYGKIQKLYSRDTDVVIFQEDKISYVLFGKDVLYNADGSSNISKIDDVLGRQVMYAGEYGISDSPESFAFDASTLYWTDSKRGATLKLGGNGIFEISNTGLRAWFKDKFIGTDDLYKIGAYDPYYDQYVLSFVGKESKEIDNTDSTLTFDERAKGWTSFHSFNPDMTIGMNNSLYSFDNGELYIHHDPDDSKANEYYGSTHRSWVAAMINDEPSTIKNLQSLSLEGSTPWDCTIKTYITGKGDFTETSITLGEFIKKEGLWYAYMRRNEDEEQLNSKAAYGIGRVVSASTTIVTFNGGNALLTSGDSLYTLVNNNLELVGTITTIINNIITLDDNSLVSLTANMFLMGRKNARIEGGNLRGYTARVDMILTPEKKEELFAVNINVAKSS